MKLPLSWLRELIEVPWPAAELAERLTSAGLEVEAITPAAPPFEGVVVAKILEVSPHPNAARLRVCRVSAEADESETSGTGQALQIVCGAANARAGLLTALARPGASLPDGVRIESATLRGVSSQGMLCSARELGLAASSEGILELPEETRPGSDLRVALDLDDPILEINVTPNRGDALSVLGIAREVAALSGTRPGQLNTTPGAGALVTSAAAASPAARSPTHGEPPAASAARLEPGAGAGRFVTRGFSGLDNTRTSPPWLCERLRRAGLRAISPIVDVTNYVMLELGQPIHAYDRAKLRGGLAARRARAGERLTLLDGRELGLSGDALVIADEGGPVGLAGIMGGAGTAVGVDTRDIVLEVAWFAPAVIAGRGRRFGVQTDASQRFERGVDWRGQERAMERASALLLALCGGSTGSATLAQLPDELPRTPHVPLRRRALSRLLGIDVPDAQVEQRLTALGMTVQAGLPASAAVGEGEGQGGWTVQPPSWRFDIAIEADLIEEVARIGGLDAISESVAELPLVPKSISAGSVDERAVMRLLTARGYQEIITYAFVDPPLQALLFGEQPSIRLANPIAADLAVMRSSLWPGLIATARENLRRQQDRVRVFELATRFLVQSDGTETERRSLAALTCGARWPEQWGAQAVAADFYDAKADLEALLALPGPGAPATEWVAAAVNCLHPERSARLIRDGQEIGLLGELHPALARELDLPAGVIMFDLDYEQAFAARLARFQGLSRFPQIRRDLSFTVPERVAFAVIRERVTVAASGLLKELRIFDVYQGEGVESGRKSVALGLIFQDLGRTLTDVEAEGLVKAVITDLQASLDARIRE